MSRHRSACPSGSLDMAVRVCFAVVKGGFTSGVYFFRKIGSHLFTAQNTAEIFLFFSFTNGKNVV
jgi:hypothetical protein